MNERHSAYEGLFQYELDGKALAQVRDAWKTGTPLGGYVFKEKIEARLKMKVGFDRRGRPKSDSNDC